MGAAHVAYAQQTQPVGLTDLLPAAAQHYDGFADGPVLRRVVSAGPGELALEFGNANGLSFVGTHNCTSCCKDSSTFEVSYGKDADWEPVVSFAAGSHGVHVVLKRQDTALSLRHAYLTDPQCVLMNSNLIPASPFRVEIDASVTASATRLTPASPPPKG